MAGDDWNHSGLGRAADKRQALKYIDAKALDGVAWLHILRALTNPLALL